MPYDLKRKTRLYVDSSPIGTQATVCQLYEGGHWRPVNHTSRPWTTAEAGYGQIERESNGICTGMYMNKMYTMGTHIEVVTDHQPLVSIYNAASKPKQLRVDRHRTKLLPFSYNVVFEEGAKTPCDYGSRHPKKADFSEKQIVDWCVETGTDIFVNRVLEDSLPSAITLDMVKKESELDEDMTLLKSCILSHDIGNCKKNLPEYYHIFHELTVIDDIVMKNYQIVIPKSLRAEVIGLAHEGHQHADKTLSFLRQSCWFPKMRKDVLSYVETCGACLSAIPRNTPVPLEPNFLPERAWQHLHADFKGPIGGRYYFHVLIDQYSKYPEVDVVTSTSFKKLRPKLDRIFSAQGIPEKITADNGPPYPGHEMKDYASEMGFRMELLTPEDPQSNGFAEAFVRILCKLLHTSVAEGKDPREVLHKYLMHYRATPHPTTGVSPAEMLNNRKIRTKLPQYFSKDESVEARQVRENHDAKKLAQKKHFDKGRRAHPKEVKPGDQILIKQQKSTTKPPFDPRPFTVVGVHGNQIDAQRGATFRRRDKNSVKVLKKRPDHLIPSWERSQQGIEFTDYNDLDIEGSWPGPSSVSANKVSLEVHSGEHPVLTKSDTGGMDGLQPVEESLQTDGHHNDTNLPDPRMSEFPILQIDRINQIEMAEAMRPEVNTPLTENNNSNHNNSNLIASMTLPILRLDRINLKETSKQSPPEDEKDPVPKLHSRKTRRLRVGDRVTFRGKDADAVWFTCSLISRAGKATGIYSMAWNVSRDGAVETIDFGRDVGDFRVLESENQDSVHDVCPQADMNAHLTALINAARRREDESMNDGLGLGRNVHSDNV